MTDLRLLPRHELAYMGKIEPLTDRGMRHEDSIVRNAAIRSNLRMHKALLSYGGRHGLPNKPSAQCLDELAALALVREEELLLAAKIESEMGRPSMLKEGFCHE